MAHIDLLHRDAGTVEFDPLARNGCHTMKITASFVDNVESDFEFAAYSILRIQKERHHASIRVGAPKQCRGEYDRGLASRTIGLPPHEREPGAHPMTNARVLWEGEVRFLQKLREP
ncbi:hypothetical protein TRAPUB_14436 [Trametes pubescens]|uniref:Uncharacterized protein n=1 Tax=Trametes pubescens TaxID=154538 RepID=A0A1M2VND6_TRAPU|nr:hypothetical protein TRAPUB_14436 [Trametes pubescens]